MDSAKVASARKAIEKAASAADNADVRMSAFCDGILEFAKEAGIPEDQHNDFVLVTQELMLKEGAGIGDSITNFMNSSPYAAPLAGAAIGGLGGAGLGYLAGDKKKKGRSALLGGLLGMGVGGLGGYGYDKYRQQGAELGTAKSDLGAAKENLRSSRLGRLSDQEAAKDMRTQLQADVDMGAEENLRQQALRKTLQQKFDTQGTDAKDMRTQLQADVDMGAEENLRQQALRKTLQQKFDTQGTEMSALQGRQTGLEGELAGAKDMRTQLQADVDMGAEENLRQQALRKTLQQKFDTQGTGMEALQQKFDTQGTEMSALQGRQTGLEGELAGAKELMESMGGEARGKMIQQLIEGQVTSEELPGMIQELMAERQMASAKQREQAAIPQRAKYKTEQERLAAVKAQEAEAASDLQFNAIKNNGQPTGSPPKGGEQITDPSGVTSTLVWEEVWDQNSPQTGYKKWRRRATE